MKTNQIAPKKKNTNQIAASKRIEKETKKRLTNEEKKLNCGFKIHDLSYTL